MENWGTDTFIKNYIIKNKSVKTTYEICYNLITNYFFSIEDIEYVYSFLLGDDINISELDCFLNAETKQRLDKGFKERVVSYYGKCIISDYSFEECQVAHIIPFSKSNPIDKYNPNNALLLSNSIHYLMDTGYFTINPDTHEVEIDPHKKNIEMLSIYKYKNKKLNIKPESIPYLRRVYNESL